MHSFTGTVLHNWDSDENQAREAGMHFGNASYAAARGLMPDRPGEGLVHGEYTRAKMHGFTVAFGFGNDAAACPLYTTPAPLSPRL